MTRNNPAVALYRKEQDLKGWQKCGGRKEKTFEVKRHQDPRKLFNDLGYANSLRTKGYTQ